MKYQFDNPDDQHAFDTIFKGYWAVKTKQLNLRSIESLEEEGYVSTFNDQWDMNIMNEQVSVYRSVAQLAEWLYEDKQFRLENPADYITIYDAIRHYVKMVANVFNNEMGLDLTGLTQDSPWVVVLKDIQKLEDLANHIYPHVQMRRPRQFDAPTTGLMGAISQYTTNHRQAIEMEDRGIFRKSDGSSTVSDKIDIRKELDLSIIEKTRPWLRRGE